MDEWKGIEKNCCDQMEGIYTKMMCGLADFDDATRSRNQVIQYRINSKMTVP
jgi:hypothetical protein